MNSIKEESRFRGIEPFERKVSLCSPYLLNHGWGKIGKAQECLGGYKWDETTESYFAVIKEVERRAADYAGMDCGLALKSSTLGLQTALRLAAAEIYGNGKDRMYSGSLECISGRELFGRKVFVSDFAPISTVNPVLYEGGEPVFIDASWDDWGMDPEALEKAFENFPDTKIVIMHHPYGFPCQAENIRSICSTHGALLIEDASESLGARLNGRPCGSFGDYSVLGFQGGGMSDAVILLSKEPQKTLGTNSYPVFKSNSNPNFNSISQSNSNSDSTPISWYKNEWLEREYRPGMLAAVLALDELQNGESCIERRKAIYDRYLETLDDSLCVMMPYQYGAEPAFQMSCMTVEGGIDFQEDRIEDGYSYNGIHGAAAPMEIYDALKAFGADAAPVYRPLHSEPAFRRYSLATSDFCSVPKESQVCVASNGNSWVINESEKEKEIFYSEGTDRSIVSSEIFRCGLCLPSASGMTEQEQERIVEIIHACFDEKDWVRQG